MALKQSLVALAVLLMATFIATSPLTDCSKQTNITAPGISVLNLTESLLLPHHKDRRSLSPLLGGFGGNGPEDMLRLATLVPAETLHLLRMVTVPLLNTTLTVPENILEGMSNVSVAGLPGLGGAHGQPGWLQNMTHMDLSSLHHGFNLGPHGVHNGSSGAGAIVVVQQRIISPMSTFFKSTINTTSGALPGVMKPTYIKQRFDNFRHYLGAGVAQGFGAESTNATTESAAAEGVSTSSATSDNVTASSVDAGSATARNETVKVVTVVNTTSIVKTGVSGGAAGLTEISSSSPAPPQVGAAPPDAQQPESSSTEASTVGTADVLPTSTVGSA